LQRLDAEFPGEIELHVVMDNYGTHKHPRVQRWLKRVTERIKTGQR